MVNLRVVDLGLIEYRAAWAEQQRVFDALLEGEGDEVLFLCEHPHVYTLGKSAREDNILVGETFLKGVGADVVRIDRGGDVTYHGPGQLVGYPVLDLKRHGIGLREYIWRLEEALLRTVAAFGIEAGRSEDAAGVWVRGRTDQLEGGAPRLNKLAAIGVRSSRYVTMHGFALNVEPDLKYFDYINPCGFTDRGVTSMARELGREVSMDEVKECFTRRFHVALKGSSE